MIRDTLQRQLTLKAAAWLLVAFQATRAATDENTATDSERPKPVVCDVLLQGGLIVDGTGEAGVVGDVAIAGDKVVAVGKFTSERAGRTIDCRNLVIAPGFIDLHSHSDRSITKTATRSNINFVTQGCTTVVTGNCGSGPIDVAEYFRQVDSTGAGTNVIHLLPQGALRKAVMGAANRQPTDDELQRMKELADKAMDEGAYGMSTGLIYVPSSYADSAELTAIAKVVGQRGGIYASHIRGEGVELLDSVKEALEIGRGAEVPVHISHFKASGSNVWGTLRLAADLIEKARQQGQVVTADQYPYSASSTSIEATLIPTWAREGGKDELRRRLRDKTQLAKIRETIASRLKLGDRIVIASFSRRPEYVGQELRHIARGSERDVVDLVVEMELLGEAQCVKFGMGEEDVRYAMQLPWVATASDGYAQIPSAEKPHPRSFGTFPRKLGHYTRDEKVITLAHAVRSASGLPADILNLDGRGYLRAGYVADIVVFDPASIADRANYDDPFQYSEGVRWVFVNGTAAVHNGTPTGALAGIALKRRDDNSER